MTRGIYVVSSEDAERVLHAVESGEPHVLVDADTFGDGLSHVPVRIVTAHVMSVAKNLPATDQAEGEGTRASLRLIRGA